MKKLVMVFALGAMLGSCGGGAAEIDVATLDSPCGCAEARNQVMEEYVTMAGEISEGLKDASADDLKSFKDDSDALESKMKDIRKKCKGDLAIDKAEEDCEAAKTYEKTAESYNKALGDTYVALKEAMGSK